MDGTSPASAAEPLWGAATTLVVAANLPDVDAFLYFIGNPDLALLCRRGWTHGVVALVLMPLLLVGLVTAWGRWRGAPVEPRALLPLAYLALLTHPFLDWLNTYGMRWLMPFSGRWFYGDTLFIVDPWLWLILGGGAFLAGSPSRRVVGAWATVATLVSLFMVTADATPGWLRVTWIVGIAALGALRFAGAADASRRPRVAIAAVFLAGAYIAGMAIAGRAAEAKVRAEVDRSGLAGVREIYAGPIAANPLAWDALVVTADGYHEARVRLGQPVSLDPEVLPSGIADPRYAAALAAPCIAGFANWLRFPVAEVATQADGGAVVEIRDARYARRGESRGFGVHRVALAADGTVTGCS